MKNKYRLRYSDSLCESQKSDRGVLRSAEFITNEKIRELCGFTRKQVRRTVDKMLREDILKMEAKGRSARYVRK